MYFYSLEPWGFDAEDSRLGILAATIARSQGAQVNAQDFMMGPNLPARLEEPEEVLDAEDQVMRMFGPPTKPGPPPGG